MLSSFLSLHPAFQHVRTMSLIPKLFTLKNCNYRCQVSHAASNSLRFQMCQIMKIYRRNCSSSRTSLDSWRSGYISKVRWHFCNSFPLFLPVNLTTSFSLLRSDGYPGGINSSNGPCAANYIRKQVSHQSSIFYYKMTTPRKQVTFYRLFYFSPVHTRFIIFMSLWRYVRRSQFN